MFDHVDIRVSDRAASEAFYDTVLPVLGLEKSYSDEEFVEWVDFGVVAADDEKPVTRRAHIAFAAASQAHVDAFHRAGVEAGYRSDGQPGLRPEYLPDYYGGFLLDPDGNSIEAVHYGDSPESGFDHLWIRVTDLAASRTFYERVAPHGGFELGHVEDGYVSFRGGGRSFSLVGGRADRSISTSRSQPRRTRSSTPSTPISPRPATWTTARRANGRSTTRATTARSCSIPTGRTSSS